MRAIEAPDEIETWRIICAAQSEPDYSEDRQVLLYGGERNDYHDGGPFILLDGGHCSCYDWEEVEWYATEYEREEILALARSKADGDGCYSSSEMAFWELVLHALVSKSF